MTSSCHHALGASFFSSPVHLGRVRSTSRHTIQIEPVTRQSPSVRILILSPVYSSSRRCLSSLYPLAQNLSYDVCTPWNNRINQWRQWRQWRPRALIVRILLLKDVHESRAIPKKIYCLLSLIMGLSAEQRIQTPALQLAEFTSSWFANGVPSVLHRLSNISTFVPGCTRPVYPDQKQYLSTSLL